MSYFVPGRCQQPRYSLCGLAAFLLLFASATTALQAQSAQGPVRPGDHISLIGNTLPDRMQHDGWLETYFYSRFPKHNLVFRNLGFSGDELTLRLRSANFGSPDDWLNQTKTDVVFAFFGYNESYAGEQGLAKFKQDLGNFIQHTHSQKYNGQSPPRLVLFSPIAHENLHNRNLPDGKENNQRLELYTQAMAEVAKANNVTFVDLFHPTLELYASSKEPLTINGVHLNEEGNEKVAEIIDRALYAKAPAPKRATEYMEKLRQAVLDKNFYWFNRYRTVDGYSIYGGRAGLKFVDGQTNRVVMQREMEVLDVMTANRDKHVWAVAQGGDRKVDDSNTPPFIPVKTNRPGPLPGGKHVFLDGEEAIQKMTPGKNIKIQLFASEKEWPELINPVQMSFDTKGRLWVATWPTYPHWKPKEEMNDRLLIFEDTNGDGKADKMTVFADRLHNPTGFEFWNGGVLLAHAPDLMFLKDTDGDDKADVRKRVLSGLDSADTHHTANSFTLDPGGALYFQEGTFHHTQVETPWGPAVHNANAGVYRYEPRAQKFETYVNFGFANPHGHVFDRWGQDIVVDGTGAQPYQAALFSGQTADFHQRHARPPQVYRQKTRPCPGIEILSSRHFPEENQGNLLVANVIGFLGIMQYKFKDDGAGLTAVEVEPLLSSTDPNFRPADMEMGPDGALYFTDWQNPIIGHMQHNLRDPSRDRVHGRIYKVTYEGRKLLTPAKIYGEPIEKLLDLLKSPEDRVRYRTRIELSGRDPSEVVTAAQKWINKLDKKDPNYEHHMLEGLWLYQNMNVVNEPLLRRVLQSPDFHARAAATRVLCYWRDRVREPLQLLQQQINDPQPRVRLEAIRALSFFHEAEALAVAVELLTHPDDQYLRFVFNETLNTLERRLGSGRLNRQNVAASLVSMLTKGDLPAERKAVLLETICRHGGVAELQTVWAQVRDEKNYPPALRQEVLHWLTEAANTRGIKLDVPAADVLQLLKAGADNSDLLPPAIRLAAAWNVKAATAPLQKIAQDNKADEAARLAAIDGLAAFRADQTLRGLTKAPHAMAIRFRAAEALAQIDLPAGAAAAAQALAEAGADEDPSSLVEAFLVRKNGSSTLGAALAKQKISADGAKRILRAMYMAGKNDPELRDVVSKFAGLEAAPKVPTAEEIRQLANEVLAKGDPARGERVFRRMDLGCMKCHAINKAGGNIGPDLGPLGSTSPVDYVIQSILDPNQSIKEEYLTKTIVTTAGQIFNGIVVERDKNRVVLKDATGKRFAVAVADIDEELNGKSLMPEGVTQILTRNELIDLIRFVSELGKPGPYAIRSIPTIQRWKRLQNVPAVLKEGVPNRDVLRDTVLRAGPQAWETVYSLVDGTLPVGELKKTDRSGVLYLQGDIQVVQGGPVEIHATANVPITYWIDEDPFESARAVPTLTPGRHRITVRLATGNELAPTLRVELRKPAESRAHFEVIHGE